MIVFRTDGNSKIGAGHIMRCLSIANYAKEHGELCKFILASDDFIEFIIKNGHKAHILHSDYSIMSPDEISNTLYGDKPSVLIIDSYFVTEEFMNVVHKSCSDSNCKLIYLDDRCKFPYSCDVLINYNISANVEDYRVLYEGNSEPVFLIGTLYTPLRKEFQNLDRRNVLYDSKNIFVSTGGSDSEHFTVFLIDEAKKYSDYTFHFVLGMMNPDKEKIKESAANSNNIFIHENVAEMSKLMLICDVAISASGSTLYELCATQTPTITYILADNQIPLAEGFNTKGIIQNKGDIRIIGNKELAESLVKDATNLIDNYVERIRISNIMLTIVDGNGAKRIIDTICKID